MTLEAKADFVFIVGLSSSRRSRGLSCHRHVEGVLEPHVMPFAGVIRENFISMHDNVKSHNAAIEHRYLEKVNIPVMASSKCRV